MSEYYISIDIESDGPCPGVNSMLQFGAVFYDPDGKQILEYAANVKEIEGGVQDAGTMNWWDAQEKSRPGIWASMMDNRVEPFVMAADFQALVQQVCKDTKSKPVCVSYPSGFDFTWLYWYLCKFNGRSCVGFSALDMKTLGMSLLNTTFEDSAKRRFPRQWFDRSLRHTHNALDDAKEQGYTFFQMRRALHDLHHRD